MNCNEFCIFLFFYKQEFDIKFSELFSTEILKIRLPNSNIKYKKGILYVNLRSLYIPQWLRCLLWIHNEMKLISDTLVAEKLLFSLWLGSFSYAFYIKLILMGFVDFSYLIFFILNFIITLLWILYLYTYKIFQFAAVFRFLRFASYYSSSNLHEGRLDCWLY